MKKLLIISYVFPPTGGAGVQRVSKFIKNLHKLNWTISVLTVKNPSVPIFDSSLLSDIPENIKIYKARTLEPGYNVKKKITDKIQVKNTIFKIIKSKLKFFFSIILIPDSQILWWPIASIYLVKILLKRNIDIIFVSAPPFSTLLFTTIWGKIFKIPVITDFRDEWKFSRNNWEKSAKFTLIKSIDNILEKIVIKNSSRIIVASPYYKKTINEKYKVNNCYTITNGYDLEDFKNSHRYNKTVELDHNKINIVYSGTVWSATSLLPFINSLQILLLKRPDLEKKIQLLIIGRVLPEENYYLEKISEFVVLKQLGYIEHSIMVNYILSADILLLTLADLPGTEKIIPGKIFEYMLCKAPVISVIPNGVCAEILSKIQGFYIVNPQKPDEISNLLEKFLIKPKRNLPVIKRGIENFDRLYLSKQLNNILFDTIQK